MRVNWRPTAVLLLTYLLAGAAQAAKPTPAPTITPPVMVDANGKTVGTLMTAWVTLTLDGRPIKLSFDNPVVATGDYYDYSQTTWYTAELRFESTDCTGTPFVRFPGDWTGYQFAGVVVQGATPSAFTLYVADLSHARMLATYSVYSEGECTYLSGGDTRLNLPILASYDLGAMFTLPLHVK